jgi:hypothetical protein
LLRFFIKPVFHEQFSKTDIVALCLVFLAHQEIAA